MPVGTVVAHEENQVGCLSQQATDELYPPLDRAPYSHPVDTDYNNYNSSSRKNSLAHHQQHPKVGRKKSRDHGVEDIRGGEGCCHCPDGWANRHTGHTCGCAADRKDKTSGAMFSFQNCTLQSDDLGNGESYWVSFEEKSFSKGEEFKVYNGKMNGIGPRSGEKCVVKVFRHKEGTESLCACEVKKSEKARVFARAFNERVREKKLRIKFTKTYWAQMDEVSKLKQLFFSGERKLTTRESVLFEDDIRVNEERPHKPRKPTLFMDCQGRNKHCLAKDLEAFAHFSYQHSHGDLVICGLDGVQDEDGFFLKTPTVHSIRREYGQKDQGKEGIKRVFRNHVCNDLCKDFIKPVDNGCDDEEEEVVAGSVCSQHCNPAPPTSTRPVLPRPESRISHNGCVMPISDSGHPSLSWQASATSEKSHMARQESTMSQITDSMSAYLEPTAPMVEELNETIFFPTPPPYSQQNVATWLLEQQGKNSFILPLCDLNPLPMARVVQQMSVESGPSLSAVSPTNQTTGQLDFNANPSGVDDTDFSGVSTTGCVDDCESLTRGASLACERKQVRFTLSTDTNSSISPSTAVTSELPTEMSTSASGSSSPTTQARSILRQQSLPSSSGYGGSQLTPVSFTQVIGQPGVLRRSATMDEGNHLVPGPLSDNPPSYMDSQMTTACWIMERCYPNAGIFLGHAPVTDNGHPQRVPPTTHIPLQPTGPARPAHAHQRL